MIASIRIVATPDGEAPEIVRQAWVGLILPLGEGKLGKRDNRVSHGVLSGPKSLTSSILAAVFGRSDRSDGYAIEGRLAIEILAKSDAALLRVEAN